MLKYAGNPELKERFGDFGGFNFTNEFQDKSNEASELLEILKSDIFEEKFIDILDQLLPEEKVAYKEFGDLKVTLVRNNTYYYTAAGALAIAILKEKKKLTLGVFPYLKDVVLKLGPVCKKIGLHLIVSLCKELAHDKEYVEKLNELGLEVDDKMCETYFNLVVLNAQVATMSDFMNTYMMFLTANSVEYPNPALVGTLAGVYGKKILDTVGSNFDAIIAPIYDGTNAVGLFKAYKESNAKLITVERTVAQEYHDGVTLFTRSAETEDANVIMCPELCDWWRMGEVVRLGCDRVLKVDTSGYSDLDETTARAIRLSLERFSLKKVLVMEV